MGNKKADSSRRDFIKMAGVGLLASTLHASAAKATETASPSKKKNTPHKIAGKGYNIVLIVTDQERHFKEWPQSAQLESREKIKSEGVSFENHYNCSNMCTSSRSVMYTGQHVQHTGMFDNTNLPWQPDMSTELPTIGHMMRDLGYYTAYKGKVHLSEAITPEANKEHKLMTDAMEPYGFSDFNPTGDHYGKTLGGYTHDMSFAGDAANWLRSKGAPLNEEGRPFFLAVNMINPHDVMYFDTDAKGQDEQETSNGKLVDPINRAPENSVYQAKHKDFPLPENLYQSITEKGRPKAHYEYHYGWNYLVGAIPNTDGNWTRYRDYYLNCLKDVDMQIGSVLDELDRQGMKENTVIIFTADHGEMGGNHNLRGKGPFSYEENIHVPMFIIHPEIKGGQSTEAVTSHLDLAPTILNLSGAEDKNIEKITSSLPGHDMTPVLSDPSKAGINSVRTGALHCFDMILTLDGSFIRETAECYAKGVNWMREKNIKPDLSKQGNIRIVFDGRYKFARYFSPLKRNTPQTWEELTGLNELELYDLKNDPQEMNNLAMNPDKHKKLIMRMNQKLNKLIAGEVGKDIGPELKDYNDWALTDLNH